MATRAQIERLSERIEALAAVECKKHIIVVDPRETNEQAIARYRYERKLGAPLRGEVILIHTGVPRGLDRDW